MHGWGTCEHSYKAAMFQRGDGTWQDCLVFMIILWIWRDHVRPWLARGTRTLFFSLGIVVLWCDVLGDGCVGVGGLLHFLRNTISLKLSQCTTDLATNKIEGWHQPPCHLSNPMNASKATYGLFKRLGQSTSLQPVRPLNDLTPFSPLTCLHANTFNLPLKTEHIWYVGFFFQRP